MPTFVLILASAAFALGVLLDLGMLMMSPMMFDAPGSEQSIYPWLIVAAMLLYPLLTLIGLILAWLAHSRQNFGRAFAMLSLPLLGVALVVAAFAALQVMCGGAFDCRP